MNIISNNNNKERERDVLNGGKGWSVSDDRPTRGQPLR